MIMALLAVTPLGCSADYSVDLGNGYSYEHWGNNFIAHTIGGEVQQVIKGQVESYLKHGDFVVVCQTGQAPSEKKYYLLDLISGGLEVFVDFKSLKDKSIQVGFARKELEDFEKSN